MFSKLKIQELMSKFSKVNVMDIQDASLRAKAAKLKKKQSGFTLLELLVVVAILAAIAGTATIALQDTDARASAAAHVAMMDELNKGIRTFRVLNKNTLPTSFDSLLEVADAGTSTNPGPNAWAGTNLGELIAIEDVATIALTADMAGGLVDGGLDKVQVINNATTTSEGDSCASGDLQATIASRNNATVAGNIFMTPAANGCGASADIVAGQTVAIWTGGFERVMGQPGEGFDATPMTTDGAIVTAGEQDAPILMVVGIGPSSNLFNANDLGGMTTVPVYRHVSETQYGRFMALFNIGTWDAANNAMLPSDQVVLTTILDGAGDTKEEELGEWDGTRNTI